MIERVESNHGIRPERLMGDTAYGSAENLAYLVEQKDIEPHVPVFDKTERKDGTFSSCDFDWDPDANLPAALATSYCAHVGATSKRYAQ